MNRFFTALSYSFSNLTLKIKILAFVCAIFALVSVAIYNTSPIAIRVPFTQVELFAPRFVFIWFFHPIWYFISAVFSSIRIPKPSHISKQSTQEGDNK